MKRNQRKSNEPDPTTRRLFSYLDGELRPDERKRFEGEIARDSVLQAEVRAHRFVFAALEEMEPHAPSHGLRARVIAALHIRPSVLSRLWT